MKHPNLYVLRHGQTEWNLLGKFQGRKNSPLTDLGQQQALQQNKLLHALSNQPTKRYTSPLGRAMQTAELVYGSMDDVIIDDRLQEIDFGDWEGMTRDYIKTQITTPYETKTWKFAGPGGETFETICDRVGDFLSEQNEPATIVTHGITAIVLRGLCMGLTQVQMLELSHEQGCLFHVSDGAETIIR
jgi:probable phosphoglycerate mutase